MTNFEAFHWNFSSSSTSEIVRSVLAEIFTEELLTSDWVWCEKNSLTSLDRPRYSTYLLYEMYRHLFIIFLAREGAIFRWFWGIFIKIFLKWNHAIEFIVRNGVIWVPYCSFKLKQGLFLIQSMENLGRNTFKILLIMIYLHILDKFRKQNWC